MLFRQRFGKIELRPENFGFLKSEMTTASSPAHDSSIAVLDYRFIVLYGICEWML